MTVAGLDDAELQRPTRCRGWLVADLLLHVVCDAQRALVALASPAAGPADVDDISYWRAVPTRRRRRRPRHAWWARRSAAAFDRPSGMVRVWSDTAPAAVRAAAAADPDSFVTTQGHVLGYADLLATLTTEAVIHHLDLVVGLPDAPPPAAGCPPGSRWPPWTACSVTRRSARRAGTTGSTCSGRPGGYRSSDQDRLELGEAAGWFPLIG